MLDDGAEWFIITEQSELDRQPELAELLDQHGRRAVEAESFVVYDLTP